MTYLSVALVVLGAGYAALLTAYRVGLRRVLHRAAAETGGDDTGETVSVVIAARDEEENIAACLESVLASRGPLREIIVVDDHSSDETASIVETIANRGDAAPIRLIRLDGHPGDRTGKALAIRTGIEHASGSLILTTDADCRVASGWVESMAACFTPNVRFVAGPVRFAPLQTVADRIQALEFAGLIAIGAGAIGIDWPNMCNSANIAYRRDVALERRFTGDARVPDDEVMLQALHREDPRSVRFCARRDALVETPPARSARAFLAQRRRWAGSGARYPSAALVLTIAAVYVFYCVLIAAAVLSPWHSGLAAASLFIAMVLKVATEASLLLPATRVFAQRDLMRWFLPAQLLQIPYVVIVGVLGVVGSVSWKGRST